MKNELGVFLEKLRGKMSLREAATKSGLSHTYIRDLELGVNRVTKTPIRPTPDTLSKLSDAYNFDYDELMRIAGYKKDNNPINNDQAKNDELYDIISRLPQDKKESLLKLLKDI